MYVLPKSLSYHKSPDEADCAADHEMVTIEPPLPAFKAKEAVRA